MNLIKQVHQKVSQDLARQALLSNQEYAKIEDGYTKSRAFELALEYALDKGLTITNFVNHTLEINGFSRK